MNEKGYEIQDETSQGESPVERQEMNAYPMPRELFSHKKATLYTGVVFSYLYSKSFQGVNLEEMNDELRADNTKDQKLIVGAFDVLGVLFDWESEMASLKDGETVDFPQNSDLIRRVVWDYVPV